MGKYREVGCVVCRYCAERGKGGNFDLESFELSLRYSMHGIGCSVLVMHVNAAGGDYCCRTISGGNDHQYEFIEFLDKKLSRC
jgi:hypothetical protein